MVDGAILTLGNAQLAQAIFDFATADLGSEVHHRPSKFRTGRDWETIFRILDVEGFRLVVNTSKGRPKLVFPDKDDKVSSTKGPLVEPAQWERKREKRGTVTPEAGLDSFDAPSRRVAAPSPCSTSSRSG